MRTRPPLPTKYYGKVVNAEVGEHIAELRKDSNRIYKGPAISVSLNLNPLHDHCIRKRYEL
jgi:hypothetical protein